MVEFIRYIYIYWIFCLSGVLEGVEPVIWYALQAKALNSYTISVRGIWLKEYLAQLLSDTVLLYVTPTSSSKHRETMAQ